MNLQFKSAFLTFFFMIVANFYAFAQEPCDPGQIFCRGACRLPRACGIGPPPPGLVVPIDSNIIWLLAAGLGLGIYYWIFIKGKSAA